ncbi:MAG: hypothetical protein Q8R92_16835 [Deltaproteobacteria bacterium]|nr:hypothetical protein [Deltaproteobacteria bacterium]
MRKRAYTKPYRGELPSAMTPYEARALCFWAAIGIAKSDSGSYPDAAGVGTDGDMGIVDSWARALKLKLPIQPRFGEAKRNARYTAKRKDIER